MPARIARDGLCQGERVASGAPIARARGLRTLHVNYNPHQRFIASRALLLSSNRCGQRRGEALNDFSCMSGGFAVAKVFPRAEPQTAADFLGSSGDGQRYRPAESDCKLV